MISFSAVYKSLCTFVGNIVFIKKKQQFFEVGNIVPRPFCAYFEVSNAFNCVYCISRTCIF